MTIQAGWYGVAASVVLALALVSVAGGSGPWVQEKDCAVTVQPGQSIQQAIDEAKEGAVICLAAGTWEENIEITKSLTLRGVGQEQTKIKGIDENKWIIAITTDAVIEAKLESFTIAENESGGIDLGGAARTTISNITITGNGQGLGLRDSAQAAISNSTISGNGLFGIALINSAQATITHSIISKNELFGIALMGSTQADITHSTISESEYGIWLASSAQAIVAISTISRNKNFGIWLWGSTRATITNSTIYRNGWSGIVLWDSAQAEIRGSTIEGNGTEVGRSGIEVWEKSQLNIIDSKILNNADWGVGAVLKQCGFDLDDFTGTVTFEDMMLDQIAGNNTTGKRDGLGNPGNHPWNRPDIPDGQVCLP